MLDLDKAKKEFEKYISNYDLKNPEIKRKVEHSYRVAEISEKIAKSLNLSNEEIEVATLIGLLHDIARFEQYTKYKTFRDVDSIDHGDYGVEILQENNYIRKYILTNKYDDIILKAIKNHNKFEIEKGLNEKELTYAKLIRDADKLDIFFEASEIFWKNNKEQIEDSCITKEIEETIKDKKLIKREKGKKQEGIDKVLGTISFVYDLNYKESFKILKQKDYINKILNQFNFKYKETEEEIKKIRKIINEYVEEKLMKQN